MSSYLHLSDYLLWIVFVVIEFALFFRLTTEWLKPIKYFLLYAALRDVLLLCLVPEPLFYGYFVTYWLGQIISCIWYSIIAYKMARRFLPKISELIAYIPVSLTCLICGWNLWYLIHPTSNTTEHFLNMQRWCLVLNSIPILGTGILTKFRKAAAISLLPLAGLSATWLWVFLGQKAWEISWIVALIGVGLILKPLLPLPLAYTTQPA